MTGRGTLVLIGTPLGNREDLAPRARRALVEADLLLCEDTRSPSRLVTDAELPPRLSCFVANEASRIPVLLEHLAQGETVAYVSEAGLPVWSDPGRALVAAALDAGHEVDVIPGPTAAAVAVCHAGFAGRAVRFEGFPPRDGPERGQLLDRLTAEPAITVLYEAGNRVPRLLSDLAAVPGVGHRKVAVARELTKLHQEVLRGTVDELARQIDGPVRGEVTVVLEGADAVLRQPDPAASTGREVVDVLLDDSLKPREKARRLADLTGLDSRDLYARLAKD